MSLQLPAILSPPAPCIPSPALTVSPLERSPKLPCPLRVGVRFWASLTLRKLANASGRIVFNIALFMDWQFISGCLPPRLSTTQFPSTTDSQCSVRWGLPPHGWCALSGARRDALPRDPAWHVSELLFGFSHGLSPVYRVFALRTWHAGSRWSASLPLRKAVRTLRVLDR